MSISWKPFSRQEFALLRNEFEVFFGGARGPGKTDAGIVWLTYDIDNPRFRALVIRKNADDLSDWVDRAGFMFRGLGVKIAYRPAVLTFPSGAIIRTGHLKDDQAYTKYQGHEYQRMLIEELTQIPDQRRYLQLIASCRSTIPELKPQVFITSNPGGVGHLWVKERFVDPAPPDTPFTDDQGNTRIYIPATIDDNPILKDKDPRYVRMLDSLKDEDEELWKAWRLGSWDVFAGQFFKGFSREVHTVKPFEPKPELEKYAGIDWGFNAPFAFLACALERVTHYDVETGDEYRFNRIWVYRELYDNEKKPHEWADIIKNSVNLAEFKQLMADPSMFHRKADGSRSIADQFKERGVVLQPANNDRIGGWQVVQNWLSLAPDGVPYMLISEACTNLIRTLPAMVHDERKVEDINCFVAGTKVKTLYGDKNIENIKVGEYVLTPIGYRRVIRAGVSGKSKTVKVSLSNGQCLKGTANHKVMVEGIGLVPLGLLQEGQILYNKTICSLKLLFTKGLSITDQKVRGILHQVKNTIKEEGSLPYTAKFMLTTMAPFLGVLRFIIRMGIRLTTIRKTSNFLIVGIMLGFISISEKIFRKNSKNGERVKRARRHLEKTLKKCVREHPSEKSRAGIVKKLLRQNIKQKSTVIPIVGQITKGLKSALFAEKARHGKTPPVHINAVGNSDEETVYNLTVEDAHLYYANGILVTNTDSEDHLCDSLRYGLIHIRWVDAAAGGVKRRSKNRNEIPRHVGMIDVEKFHK